MGYELEGDPRHAELVVAQLELGNAAPLTVLELTVLRLKKKTQETSS